MAADRNQEEKRSNGPLLDDDSAGPLAELLFSSPVIGAEDAPVPDRSPSISGTASAAVASAGDHTDGDDPDSIGTDGTTTDGTTTDGVKTDGDDDGETGGHDTVGSHDPDGHDQAFPDVPATTNGSDATRSTSSSTTPPSLISGPSAGSQNGSTPATPNGSGQLTNGLGGGNGLAANGAANGADALRTVGEFALSNGQPGRHDFGSISPPVFPGTTSGDIPPIDDVRGVSDLEQETSLSTIQGVDHSESIADELAALFLPLERSKEQPSVATPAPDVAEQIQEPPSLLRDELVQEVAPAPISQATPIVSSATVHSEPDPVPPAATAPTPSPNPPQDSQQISPQIPQRISQPGSLPSSLAPTSFVTSVPPREEPQRSVLSSPIIPVPSSNPASQTDPENSTNPEDSSNALDAVDPASATVSLSNVSGELKYSTEAARPGGLQWSTVVHEPGAIAPAPPAGAPDRSLFLGAPEVGSGIQVQAAQPVSLPVRSGFVSESLVAATEHRWFWGAALAAVLLSFAAVGFMLFGLEGGEDVVDADAALSGVDAGELGEDGTPSAGLSDGQQESPVSAQLTPTSTPAPAPAAPRAIPPRPPRPTTTAAGAGTSTTESEATTTTVDESTTVTTVDQTTLPATTEPDSTSTTEDTTSSTSDTSTPETSTPETSTPETSTPETSTPETSTPETSTPETSTPETSTPETSTPETSTPETSTPETSTPSSSTP